jgi:hypothetical protein
MRSNLDSREGGKLIFSTTDFLGLYLECTGFAPARIAVRAFKLATIPALAIEIVYYSIASCKMVL